MVAMLLPCPWQPQRSTPGRGVEAARLSPDFPLGDRLSNSIARAGLQARLHRALGGMPAASPLRSS
jgi:hypothetical protein